MNCFTLEIPNETHKKEYERIMDKWEQSEADIQPELMRRYRKKQNQILLTADGLNIVRMTAQQAPCCLPVFPAHCFLC